MLHLRRTTAAVTIAAAAVAAVVPVGSATATAPPPNATYQVTIGAVNGFLYPDDTPAAAYIDKDGTFYYQESYSLYAKTDPRAWEFYSGNTFDDATLNTAISNSVNPANPLDANNDTTWRCNNSPTGQIATYSNGGTGYYAEKNYCDLLGTWVDPDTGDWYGLVHDEFTPEPFGRRSFSHYDGLDYAVSMDQGKTWTIKGHAVTSPYSTTRGDTAAFPNGTFDYGDGDPRLFVDYASGYFYVYYGSRIVPKKGTPGSTDGLAHVARAPISGKMAGGTWQKWYDGTWSQPGIGGLESNMVPVDASNPNGYTPVAADYHPATPGTVDQQIAAGKLPPKSPLFVMNITYDAYLGLYIGEPEAVNQSAPVSQQYYATDDLSTQKWHLIGDSGAYKTDSWYRWFVDSKNATSMSFVGKDFRAYCAIACSNSDGEYAGVTIDSSAPAAPIVDPTQNYVIDSDGGRVLAQVAGSSQVTSLDQYYGWAQAAWSITGDGDGSYKIVNAGTGQALGVDSSQIAGRAWGAKPTATPIGASGPTVGQEWFIVKSSGAYKIVNRYSGLVLAMSSNASQSAETAPLRTWPGGGRTEAEQTVTFGPAHPTQGPEAVFVPNPGDQTASVGAAANMQVNGVDSKGKALTYSATGLPAGLSISSTGLISGTPTAAGTATVTVTAASGHATGSTTFTWTVS